VDKGTHTYNHQQLRGRRRVEHRRTQSKERGREGQRRQGDIPPAAPNTQQHMEPEVSATSRTQALIIALQEAR
jgi:hypothetical protein